MTAIFQWDRKQTALLNFLSPTLLDSTTRQRDCLRVGWGPCVKIKTERRQADEHVS
jgi:hypothetical protein